MQTMNTILAEQKVVAHYLDIFLSHNECWFYTCISFFLEEISAPYRTLLTERSGNYNYSLNLSFWSRVIFSSNAIDPCIKHGSP